MEHFKPMIYKNKYEIKTLASGTYKVFKFAIISYGTHPCAYVGIPYDLYYPKLSEKGVLENIDCHGGVTFNEYRYNVEGYYPHIYKELKTHKVIGWDYSHYADYSGIFPEHLSCGLWLKRWTTREILVEINCVIDQLSQLV